MRVWKRLTASSFRRCPCCPVIPMRCEQVSCIVRRSGLRAMRMRDLPSITDRRARVRPAHRGLCLPCPPPRPGRRASARSADSAWATWARRPLHPPRSTTATNIICARSRWRLRTMSIVATRNSLSRRRREGRRRALRALLTMRCLYSAESVPA